MSKRWLTTAALGATCAGMLAAGAARAETPALTADDQGPCRDTWINYAYRTTFSRKPIGAGDVGECNIRLYAGGAWKDYDQLKRSVRRFGSSRYAVRKALGGGAVYELIVRNTNSPVNAMLKVLDRFGVASVWNIMNQQVRTYSLQGVSDSEDLGDGTAIIAK